MYFFSKKGIFTQSIWLTMPFFFFFLEGSSGRTIEPLMCSDIISGSSPTIQPNTSQTDLHTGPSLGVAGSMVHFRSDLLELMEGLSQHNCKVLGTVRTTKMGQRGSCHDHMQKTTRSAHTQGPSPPTPPGRSSDRIWAKRDPAKPVNSGETNLSRLFSWHQPESKPCPQAKV